MYSTLTAIELRADNAVPLPWCISIYLVYSDVPLDMEMWAFLTRSQCRVSGDIKALGLLVIEKLYYIHTEGRFSFFISFTSKLEAHSKIMEMTWSKNLNHAVLCFGFRAYLCVKTPWFCAGFCQISTTLKGQGREGKWSQCSWSAGICRPR